jgi:hypothetical protein
MLKFGVVVRLETLVEGQDRHMQTAAEAAGL